MSKDLQTIIDGAREELREWAGDNPDNDDPDYDGSLHEIADGAVPVYTSDLFEVAANNIELGTTEPELGPAFDGSATPANIIAANIYEAVEAALREEWDEIMEEREEEREAEEEDTALTDRETEVLQSAIQARKGEAENA